MSQFHVKTGIFEGPLDLLLSLIEKHKLHVSDFSLAEIADDFVLHIRGLPETSLRETANFVVIASALMLIKSRSLLPGLPITGEEEGSIEDLKNRLRIYSRMKELALHVRGLFGKRMIWERGEAKESAPVFSPGADNTVQNIFLSAQSALAALPKPERFPEAQVKRIITLEEMMSRLAERIERHMKMSFRDFSGMERRSIIVSFLALLELMKRGVLLAKQEGFGGDIEIETRKVSVPRY